MRGLRTSLSWLFALSAFFCFGIVVQYTRLALHPPDDWPPSSFLREMLVPIVFSIMGVIFTMAWWAEFRQRRSARAWGMAASAVLILTGLFPILLYLWFYSRVRGPWSELSMMAVDLGTGAVGLIAFARSGLRADEQSASKETEPMTGDGTISLINKGAGLLVLAVSYSVYSWWLKWAWEHGALRGGIVGGTLWLILIGLAVTTFHELGHASVGLGLGMKLLVFYVGPLRWLNRGGRWEFKFVPQEILMAGGATGVVPATPDFEAWRDVAMVAGGPLANLATAAAAFWIASLLEWDSAGAAVGPLVLFGAFSMAAFACNLVPARIGNVYTDGARIYQDLVGGPWADFHRAVSLITSSTVTSIRPRDFEIDTIERAEEKIGHGMQGLMLRLYACHHWLDSGRPERAIAALKDAERIYSESITDLPAALHTVFVIANALLLRDADAVRQWWRRMEAKKPTRFNVDYWMARAAFAWAEGNMKDANEAWEKSNLEAQKLPHAGAYEFDRYLCGLLREAIDASAAG